MSLRPSLPAAAPNHGVPDLVRVGEILQRGLPALGICAVALATGLALAGLFPDQALAWTAEHGPVETITVIAYALTCGIALLAWPRVGVVAALVALLALLMALREVDAHAAFTRFGIFSSRLYFRPDVPLAEKLGAGGVVLGLGFLLIAAIRTAWPRLVAEGGRVGISLGGLFLFAVLLKQMDALPRQLMALGAPLSPEALALSKAVEETGEAFLPVLLLLALLQAVRRAG